MKDLIDQLENLAAGGQITSGDLEALRGALAKVGTMLAKPEGQGQRETREGSAAPTRAELERLKAALTTIQVEMQRRRLQLQEESSRIQALLDWADTFNQTR